MLRVISSKVKTAWNFGVHVSTLNLPPDTPVSVLIELSDRENMTITIASNDQASVQLEKKTYEPGQPDLAKLYTMVGGSEPLEEQDVGLNESLASIQETAAGMAAQAMRYVLQNQ